MPEQVWNTDEYPCGPPPSDDHSLAAAEFGKTQEGIENTMSLPGELVDTKDFKFYDAKQMGHMDEVCILVNENDEVVGSAPKKVCHAMNFIQEGMLHRAFSVFLFDGTGTRLLLQQRAKEKITFPDCWTNTCCSHPLFNDEEREEHNQLGVKRAAIRKLHHELGIEGVSAEDLHFVTRVHYKASSDNMWGEHEIDYILFLKRDVTLHVNRNEVKDHRYMTRMELDELLMSSSNLTPWFRLIVETYLFEWWEAFESDMPLASPKQTTIYRVN
jgi:isopentenyl-diphosphate delta-isomerase